MYKKIYSIRQKIVEYYGKRKGGNVFIYMFHCVTDTIDHKKRNISITPNQFKKFINRKIGEGMEFISISQLRELDCNQVYGILTFDDIYMSAYENAIPYLESNDIPFTCFVSPGLVGKSSYIGKGELDQLKKSVVCTIGGHGLHHKLFRTLSSADKKSELSREEHEKLLNCSVNCFAFPYGSIYACDSEAKSMASKEYSFCFSTLNFSFKSEDIHKYFSFMPRINVSNRNFEEL